MIPVNLSSFRTRRRPAGIADDIRTFAGIGVHELIFDFRGQSKPKASSACNASR